MEARIHTIHSSPPHPRLGSCYASLCTQPPTLAHGRARAHIRTHARPPAARNGFFCQREAGQEKAIVALRYGIQSMIGI